MCTQTVVIARACCRQAQQILILVDCLDDSGQEQQELCVGRRGVARLEQVLAAIGRDRPVIVLTRTVDALKRLFVQQADEAVTVSDALHDLHGQLVVVDRNVGGLKDRSHLVLAGCDLVVLGLGVDAELPQLFVKLCHECLDTRTDGAEIVVIHLLTLGCGCTEQGTAGQNEVGTLGVIALVDEEIFLLRADRGGNMLAVLAEQAQYAASLLGDRFHRAQKRGLLVEDLAGVRAECRRDAQGVILNECIGGRVPCGVTACLKGRAQTARREGRCVRLALDELLARKLHDDRAFGTRGDERVMLFRGDTGHRLEPMGIMGRPHRDGPVLHCVGHDVCNRRVECGALRDRALERLEYVFGQTLLHDRFVEHHTTEQFGYFAHGLPPIFNPSSNFERRPPWAGCGLRFSRGRPTINFIICAFFPFVQRRTAL